MKMIYEGKKIGNDAHEKILVFLSRSLGKGKMGGWGRGGAGQGREIMRRENGVMGKDSGRE